jgi:hypothetical protein
MQGKAQSATIKVVDIAGRELVTEYDIISNGKVITLDVSSLPQGTYFIRIITGNKTQVERFSKM